MNYYVVAPDGQKYGPGDVVMLNQWAQQGRVLPTTVVEDSSTGARFAASQVPGIMFAPVSVGQDSYSAQPPGYQQYPRTGYGVMDNGDGDYQKALIFGILGLLCCPLIFSSIGIYFASLAQRKGHPKGQSIMTFCIASLVIGFVLGAVLNTLVSGFSRF
jgi:hypothetical protein